MCGRYHLDEFWNLNEMLERLRLGVADIQHDLFLGSKEVFPRTFQPIIRLEDGEHIVEKRRWGFHRTWPDPAKPDKWIKRELINAVGATVHKLHDAISFTPLAKNSSRLNTIGTCPLRFARLSPVYRIHMTNDGHGLEA